MKYIKRYQQIFESSKVSYKYLIKKKNWEYELGYVYSPNLRTWSHYRDPSVNRFINESNGFSDGLFGYNFGELISKHFGVPLKDICTLVINKDVLSDEFSFIEDSYLTKRNFVIVELGKRDYLIKEYDKDEPNFRVANYKNLIMDVVEDTLTDDELDNISSWHVTIQYYETNGIKYISYDLGGMETYIFKKSDFESIIDMTKSCSYYRYVDKEKQSLRISNQHFNFLDIKDIFLDVLDNGITLEDFAQLGENKVMVMFKRDNIVFSESDIDVLDECLVRFEDTYSCKFDRIDISRSKILYTNTHEHKGEAKEYNKVSDLLNIGELKYDEHLRIHYLYFVFNLQ